MLDKPLDRKPLKRKTPYQRIVRAAERRTGVRLSFYDVQIMAQDTAISDLAENDDETRLEEVGDAKP